MVVVPDNTTIAYIGAQFKCVSSKYCGSAFDYTISIVEANSEVVTTGTLGSSHNAPIKISYNMMGSINIVCAAKSRSGGYIRVSKAISVEGPPSAVNVTRRAQDMSIIPKTTATVLSNEVLLCESHGYPLPDIEWSKISSPSNYPKHELQSMDAVLKITSLDPPGLYEYACTAKSSLGHVANKHKFTILNKFYRQYSAKNIAMYYVILAAVLFIAFSFLGLYVVYGDIYHA